MISMVIWRHAGRLAIFCLIFAMSACTKTKMVKKSSADARPTAGWMDEPDIHDAQFADNTDIKQIYFEFDRYYLNDASQEILKQNAEFIKKTPEWEVLVEGHCDERGSIGYNLTLGQKRAQVVRKYYLMLGVPGGRTATISYGEEKPVCQESNEECWSRNRRAQTKIKTLPTRSAGIPEQHK